MLLSPLSETKTSQWDRFYSFATVTNALSAIGLQSVAGLMVSPPSCCSASCQGGLTLDGGLLKLSVSELTRLEYSPDVSTFGSLS